MSLQYCYLLACSKTATIRQILNSFLLLILKSFEKITIKPVPFMKNNRIEEVLNFNMKNENGNLVFNDTFDSFYWSYCVGQFGNGGGNCSVILSVMF